MKVKKNLLILFTLQILNNYAPETSKPNSGSTEIKNLEGAKEVISKKRMDLKKVKDSWAISLFYQAIKVLELKLEAIKELGLLKRDVSIVKNYLKSAQLDVNSLINIFINKSYNLLNNLEFEKSIKAIDNLTLEDLKKALNESLINTSSKKLKIQNYEDAEKYYQGLKEIKQEEIKNLAETLAKELNQEIAEHL
jgi:hypothetical protein